MTDSKHDNIYANSLGEVPDFVFDERVTQVFDDMISRSVPGYRTTISLIAELAGKFIQAGTNAYDLGCSTGAALFAMQQGSNVAAHYIGYDTSEAMVAQCLARRDAFDAGDEIAVQQADIRTAAMENASMAVLNFTLQFLPPDQRGALMQRIAGAMRPGGVLVISEKLVFDDDAVNNLFIDLHHQYKRSQGYSDLEIAQKRAAIEKVLVPDTLDTHKRRLAEAGFSRSEVWFQCFNFASILAIK